jgi:DNA-binding IscR family transcriptional regulator
VSNVDAYRARAIKEIEKTLNTVKEASLEPLIYEIMKNYGFSRLVIFKIFEQMEKAGIIEIEKEKVRFLL